MKKWTEEQEEEFVKRYLAGESAASLAKEADRSRPGFYLWIKRHEARVVAESITANMNADGIEAMDIRDVRIENSAHKKEKTRLKRKLFEILLEIDQ